MVASSRPEGLIVPVAGGHAVGSSSLDGARAVQRRSVGVALARGVQALVAKQAADGSWEGEVVWSPMLAAQLVLASHLMGRSLDEVRRRRLLLHFERTLSASGTWGLSEWSAPSLFVTTLVYVAARLLGASAHDPLLRRALAFIREEDVTAIPSWGKFWLAMMNLYGWEGVNPVSPELWSLPRWLPIHPSRYYCHTRHIYMAMATLYGERLTAPRSPLIDSIRLELYPNGFDAVDFVAARNALRPGDLYARPSSALRAAYLVLGWLERMPGKRRRAASLRALRERIRFELLTTDYASISPVSGLLNILALHQANPGDPDVDKAFAKLDDWIWEDDERGARVTGALSITWDTSFAAQALAEASPRVDAGDALERADRFLASQQILGSFSATVGPAGGPPPSPGEFDRVDPDGGYCFAGVWHGWPVSDCTAEALLARLESPYGRPTDRDVERAVQFILRAQNADGGFGSYESRRTSSSLEWLNPAEMFGDSMTEGSYVECTASCLAALCRARPHLPDASLVTEPIARALAHLRAAQLPSGAWPGSWGVRLIYGTMFGIRGLVAAGVPPDDPQVRRASSMIKSHQRPDGGWGEAHVAAPREDYREGLTSQVIQTAWALSLLLTAGDSDWDAIDRAAHFLADAQLESGDWSQEEPAGVFFRTALLDYTLYKSYFPVWALAQYEQRRPPARAAT